MRFLAYCVLSLFLTVTVGCSRDVRNIGKGPHIEVSLLSDQESITPGVPFNLGVHFKPEPGWHIYWKNPGDSGLAPKFTWETPPGLTIQSAIWPTPSRIEVGPLVNYGYDETLLTFPANFTPSSENGEIEVTVGSQWLVCKDECLPGSAKLTLRLQLNRTGPPTVSSSGQLFTKYLSLAPPPLARVAIAVEERENHVLLSLLPLDQQKLPRDVLFFPEEQRLISNSAPQKTTFEGSTLRLLLERDSNRSEPIEEIKGVLFAAEGWGKNGEPRAVRIDTESEKKAVEVPAPSTDVGPQSFSVSTGTSGASRIGKHDGLLLTIFLALLGGFFLNLMPCVFPVLSIKIMGFMHCAKECPTTVKKHGLAFSIGVILSFLVLAALLLTLRAGGAQLGWGFQLQSPLFVLAMVGVFFVLGLYFLVDLNFGSSIQSLACKGKLPPSLLGSFLNGVLATAVATPCTGPFMGTALAATVTLPPFQSMFIFLALGVGMSLPYLVLSFQPRFLCYLPRPGEWMVTFKQIMAFPLFASAIWLTRVFGRQVGIPAPSLTLLINVLWGLLLLGLAVWLLARTQHTSRQISRRIGQVLALACFALGIMSAYPSPSALESGRSHQAKLNHAISGAKNAVEVDPFGLEWEMFSAERLQELVNSNVPVYLDFTAEWCITCKVNERVVFGSASVRELLRKKKVALIKGDWTSMDSEITKALEKFGRNGVPLNVLYKGGAFNREPVIFPNVLSPGAVISELEQIESAKAG